MPKVKTAASKCGIHFLCLPELLNSASKSHLNSNEVVAVEEQNDPLFTGGPRPTMTKLMVFSLFFLIPLSILSQLLIIFSCYLLYIFHIAIHIFIYQIMFLLGLCSDKPQLIE